MPRDAEGVELDKYVGARGCYGNTSRLGRLRKCAQQWTVTAGDGMNYCYYHDPDDPKKFGEGYCDHSRGYCDKRYSHSAVG